jgi:hypothetical protein
MYRIVLACHCIPVHEGLSGAREISEEFSHRPLYKNVKCEWDGSRLILQADNDFDSSGLALMDEFSDAILPASKMLARATLRLCLLLFWVVNRQNHFQAPD